MKKYFSILTSILFLLFTVFLTYCTIWDVEELREKSKPDNNNVSINQTPIADDFIINNLSQIVGSVTAVTITPKANKTTGAITIYYDGVTLLPEIIGSYTVTFDVTASEGWNEVTGLFGGVLIISKIAGEFIQLPAINIIYTAEMTLTDITLPDNYAWNNTSTLLNAGDGQQFQAIYTDPSGNYASANGYITINIAKADGVFKYISDINTIYEADMVLADINLPNGYQWKNPTTILHAGDDQIFSVVYTDPSGNYTEADGNVTVNIEKGDLPYGFGNIILSEDIYFEEGLTLANILLPDGYKWDNPETLIFVGELQYFSGTYTHISGNYKTINISISINVKEGDINFPSHPAINTEYTPALTLADLVLETGYSWNYPATSLNSGGNLHFAATYTDPSGNYSPTHGNIIVNVAKAPGVFYFYTPFDFVYESGLTLASLSLSAGYEWDENLTTVLNAGNYSFKALYTNPNGNYTTASGSITVNVEKASMSFPSHPVIDRTYQPGLTLNNILLQTGYEWNNPLTILNANNNQQFTAAYTDPSGNYETVHGNITVNIAKAEGASVAAPTFASRTNNSITINAVPAPGNGQFVEYAINSVDAAPVNGWQIELTFSGLSAGRIYYIFARAAENTNYNAGAALSAVMEIPNTGIDIGNPAIKLYLDGNLLVNGGTTTFNQASQIFIVSIDSGTYSEIVWYLNGSIVDQGTSRFTITLSRQILGSFNIMVEVTSVSGAKNVGSHSFVIQ